MYIENFKYIKNVSEAEGVILINGQIGNSVDKRGNVTYGINGADFGAEMLYLEKVCKNITVRINSIGGSVLEGYSIASAIYNSSVPVKTVIDGLAASTALWCAAAGTNRVAKDYATGMIHGSTGSEDKAMTELVDKTINIQLSNRSKKTPEEVKSMMEKETWLNASELLANGFIDEIENTGRKLNIKKSKNLADIANIYNSLEKPKNMSKINTLLKISNNADESEQELAIAKLNSDLTNATKELAEANAKLEALETEKATKEAEAKTALKNKATEMANAAQKAGKIKDSEVAGIIENASKDQASFDFVSNMVNRLGNTKEAKRIFNASNAVATNEEKTYAELEKENPKALVEMYKNDRPKYDELLNAYKASK